MNSDGERCVVVIDDHPLIAAGIGAVLATHGVTTQLLDPGHVNLGERLDALRPDLVLIDLNLGIERGDDLVTPIADTGATVLVMTGVEDRARIGRCLLTGASGALTKSMPLRELCDRVRAVLEGRPANSRTELEELRTAALPVTRDAETSSLTSRLSNRELGVLQRLVDGWSASEIAAESFVSLATVRSQIRSILAKLGVHSQVAAVSLAVSEGWRPTQGATRLSDEVAH